MSTSQNGWPVALSTDHLVRFTAGGRSFWAANADVAVIAEHVIGWFAEHIEPIDAGQLDDWSWVNRAIRDSTTQTSNHASATAWDLNATRHPRGVRGTFTRAQVKAFDLFLAGLRTARGTLAIRWGEHYIHAPTDGMHIEINCSPAEARVLAAAIREATMLTPADIEKIADAVMARLASAPIVPNKPTDPSQPPAPNWTVVGVLAAADLKADQQGRVLAEIHAAVVKPTA